MSKLDFEKLSQVKLTAGQHDNPRSGGCAMDMVSWLQYGHAGDHPECVCPVIATFIRQVNDFLPDDQRQRLVPYLLRFSGTVSKEHEQQRAEYLAWKSVTVFTPLVLEAAELREDAEKLKALPQNTSMQELEAAASAASAARAGAENKLYDAVFETIDGLLSIGPSGVVDLLPVEAPSRLEKFLELQKERVSA